MNAITACLIDKRRERRSTCQKREGLRKTKTKHIVLNVEQTSSHTCCHRCCTSWPFCLGGTFDRNTFQTRETAASALGRLLIQPRLSPGLRLRLSLWRQPLFPREQHDLYVICILSEARNGELDSRLPMFSDTN